MQHHNPTMHNVHSEDPVRVPTYTLPRNVVLQIPLARHAPCGCGLTADCGCPPPDSVVSKFSRQYFVPPEAASFVNLEELNELIDELNLIHKNNTLAAFPIIVVLPIAGCVDGYYQLRRNSRLEAAVEQKNQKVYVPRKCHWEFFSPYHGPSVSVAESLILIDHNSPTATVASANICVAGGIVEDKY
jgi:hypothetical protein